jgi:hypothetical protein
LTAVLAYYPKLAASKKLEHEDVVGIIQLLHHSFRSRATESQAIEIAGHVQSFLKSFKSRKLPPAPRVSLHLLGYFKESGQYDEGISFWDWVVKQDRRYVNPAVCGAAIELFAKCGRGLAICEQVYEYALKEFSANFNEYHMSHGAIVSRRDQPTMIPQTSTLLLQAIIKARFAYGDWRNAYLALDTALRLHPTQLPGNLFISIAHERPVHEAYQLFCLLCQSAGSSIGPRELGAIIADLLNAQIRDSDEKLDLDIAMLVLNAIRMVLGNNVRLNETHQNMLLKAGLNLLPVSQDGTGAASNQADGVTATQIYSQVRSIFSALAIQPNIATYSTMIKAAGEIHDKSFLLDAIEALKASNQSSDNLTLALNVTLKAVAKVFGADHVESVWNSRDHSVPLNSWNWVALARATAIAGNQSFLESQLSSSDLASDPEFLAQIKTESEQYSQSRPQPPNPSNRSYALPFFDALSSFLTLLQSPSRHTLSTHPPSPYTPSSPIPEEWQSTLYDALTLSDSPSKETSTNVSSTEPSPTEDSPTDLSLTEQSPTLPNGFTLAQIRYNNWKGMNLLLSSASAFEARMSEVKNEAIRDGKPPAVDRKGRRSARQQLRWYFEDREKEEWESEEEWRKRVLELRRPN